MATKYATAKEAIDAKNAINTPSPTQTTPVTPTAPAPIASPTTPTTPTVPTPPRVEGQWNYGTADNQVLGEKPTVAQTQPTPTVKPSTAKEAIAQGFKQEIKPVAKGANAPLTTEIGREAKLGQLPNVQVAQNQAEQAQINTQNLKSSSGQQLWSNLDTISKNNPSLLASRDAYDKAFGYQGKDAGEKALVDAYWNARKNDSNAIYNSLATGQKLPAGIKGPALDDAIIRHQDTTRFENLNPYQLSKVINSELIPGTQTYNDLMAKNPQLVTDAMKLASINTPVTARTETKTNWQDTLSAYLSRSPVMSNPTTVATIMNSDPNIATKTNEVQAVEDKLTEAKDRLKNIQKNVTERYKGTGATKQTINAKALAESQDIIDEITMLEANKASASSALSTLIQNAKDNYAYARQDRQDALDQYNKGFAQLQAMVDMGMRQDAQEYQQQKDAVERDLQMLQYYTNIDQANAKEARGYDFQTQQDLRNFEQQKELAKMGYQNQYNLANLGFNQDMAKIGLQQAFTSGQNATAQQNEMIKAAMSQGLSYEDAKARVMGTNSGVGGDLRGLASQYPGEAWAKNNNPTGIKSAISERTKQLMKDAGVQWATGSNPPPSESGTYMQFATIEDGLKAHAVLLTQASYPNVYDRLKQWVGTSEGDNYAKQVMEMAGLPVDKNLRFDALKPEQMDALLSAHIKKESPGLYKYLQTAQTTPAAQPIDPSVAGFVDMWDKGTMDLETIMTKAPEKLRGKIASAIQERGGVPYRSENDPAVISLRDKVNTMNSLIENTEQLENVSGGIQRSPWDKMTKKKSDYLSQVQNILDGGVIQQLIDAKAAGATFGALSNEELKMLQAAASPLANAAVREDGKITGFDMSETQFKTELSKMMKIYNDKINRMTGNVNISEKSNASFDPDAFAKAITDRINANR